MVRYSLFSNDGTLIKNFKKMSMIYGIVFIIIGLLGLIYPVVISVVTAIFYGWLLLFGAIAMALHTWQTNKKDWLGWLKTFVLFLVAMLVIFNPLAGVAALGFMFAFYFFMDAFSSIALAFELRPLTTWWVSLFNGILSAVLGFIIMSNWPLSSLFLVGLLVGVNLFFDGIALLSLGRLAKVIEE